MGESEVQVVGQQEGLCPGRFSVFRGPSLGGNSNQAQKDVFSYSFCLISVETRTLCRHSDARPRVPLSSMFTEPRRSWLP